MKIRSPSPLAFAARIWIGLIVVGVLGGTAPCRAQPNSAGPIAPVSMPGSRATRFRLPNGLDVVLQENHRQPRVAVLMVYDVGARDEPPGYGQLAHLVEHLTYRGSRHLSAYQGMSSISRYGSHQGITAPDFTIYESAVSSNALETVLWVESDRMAFSVDAFDARSLEVERRTVESELRLEANDVFGNHVKRAMFGAQHPYARDFAAATDLARIQLSDALWFFQENYRPSNAHLVVVGDFNPTDARALVERYFGPIVVAPRHVTRRRIEPQSQFAAHSLWFELPRLARERMVLAWPLPVASTRERMIVRAFLGYFHQFLRDRLLKDDRLATEVEFSDDVREGGAHVSIEIALVDGATADVIQKAILEEWEAMWKLDWVEALNEVKQRGILGTLKAWESPLWQAHAHLRSLLGSDAPVDWEDELAGFRSLSSADLAGVSAYFETHPWLVARASRSPEHDPAPAEGRLTIE